MKKPDLRIERRPGWIGSAQVKLYLSGSAFAAGAGRTIVRSGIRRRLPALSAFLRTARIGFRSTSGTSLTAVLRRRRRHQFIPRQFAVAVLVETFERSTGICDFVSINDAVVIRVERGNDWRNGRTRTLSIFSTLRCPPGRFVGVLSLCGITPRNSTESQCQECDSACLFCFHVLCCFEFGIRLDALFSGLTLAKICKAIICKQSANC